MSLRKLVRTFFVAGATTLLLTGCDDAATRLNMSTESKPQFYEYDGGMINLSQVSVVATQAMISISINPRGPQGEYGTETRALHEAHTQFCRQSLSISGYNGGIPGSARALKEAASEISAKISSDVVDTCAVEIKTSAAIILDNLTITQTSGAYVIPVASNLSTGKTEELAETIRALIEENVQQPSEWETQYRALQSKVSL